MNIRKTATIFAAALAGGLVSVGAYDFMSEDSQLAAGFQPAPVKMVNYNSTAPENVPDFTFSAEKTVNSVVHVKSTFASQRPIDPLQFLLHGQHGAPRPQLQTSSGSGVIISQNGYIVTNNHVVANARQVEVVLNDRSSYVAEVVGTDPATDIALLKVDAESLPYIEYGNSDNVKIGEWVLAVGNPFNLNSTVTAGIVSAKGRSINILENNPEKGIFPIESFIQTDAAVNPGNSGGALVNTTGELVGINTAIASGTGYYTGYSFAVPVNIVKKVVSDLVEFGVVQRAFLGVTIRDIDQKFSKDQNLGRTTGVYVTGLADDGAATKAGINSGDIITKVGEVVVKSVPELQEQVSRFRPGDKVDVTVIRNGKVKVLPVILRNSEGGTGVVTVAEKKESLSSLLGATFAPVSQEEVEKLRIKGGAKVEDLGKGKLLAAGIREGFIITSINHEPVLSPEDLTKKLSGREGGVLIEGVYPNGMRAYYGFGM